MISISAEERPSLKLTIEASAPMDVLDIYQDEYGVFFAKYFNSSVEKIEIEGIDARVLYSLNCADLHPKYGYIVREGFEKKDISEIRAYHRNLVENTQI